MGEHQSVRIRLPPPVRDILIQGDSETSSRQENRIIKYIKETLNSEGENPYRWKKIFLWACVIAVVTDPFFFYIPIIYEDEKCVGSDKTVKIAALLCRTFTDIFFVMDLYYQIRTKFKKQASSVSTTSSACWRYVIILTDVLAILPLPQVLIIILFSKVSGLKSLENFLVVCQFFSRNVRTYMASEELMRTPEALGEWTRGALFLVLYITASHVLGAFWYFLAIQRQTACWQSACKELKVKECVSSTFECKGHSRANWAFLNEICPVDPPNTTFFNLGIFTDAIKMGIVGPMNFPKKFFYCYWWGLRHLSSFGQNLETTDYVWEVFFAGAITVVGLMLFTYLIGNIQTQLTTRKIEIKKLEEMHNPEMVKKMEMIKLIEDEELKMIFSYGFRNMFGNKLLTNFKLVLKKHIQDAKEHHKRIDWKKVLASFKGEAEHSMDIIELTCRKLAASKNGKDMLKLSADLWMHNNNIPKDWKPIFRQIVGWRLEDNKDVNLQTLLSILPLDCKVPLKKHLCLATIKKLPMLRNMNEQVLQQIINHLKPAVYTENSYIIREGEPLDLMLFITQGTVWSFPANNKDGRNYKTSTSFMLLEKGDIYGEELLQWTCTFASSLSFPISPSHVKSRSKVEALILTANDLMNVVSNNWWHFTKNKRLDHTKNSNLERLESMALQGVRNIWKKYHASLLSSSDIYITAD